MRELLEIIIYLNLVSGAVYKLLQTLGTGGGISDFWQNVTGEPEDLKNCDVTKIKLQILKNFQIYFFDFRLLLLQPENVGKNCKQPLRV